MFDHDGPGRRRDEHRGGRHIEQVELVAAGATQVQGGPLQVQQTHVWVHRTLEKNLHEPGDFRRRLTLDGKRLQQLRLLGIRHRRIEQEVGSHFDLARGKFQSLFQVMYQRVHGRTLASFRANCHSKPR